MARARDLIGPFPAGSNPEEYDALRRRVLWSIPSGIYLVGSRSGEHRNLMTCSWVSQVCMDPKLLAVGVEREARTNELIRTGNAFCCSLVGRDDRAVVRHFVKPAVDDRVAHTLNDLSYRDAHMTGCPIPDLAMAFLDCSLERMVELGSHTLFIGEIVDAGFAAGREGAEVLRMEDTRMSYGG